MGNLFSGIFNLQGDKVDMGILEMLFYGLVPMMGQIFMRIFKYGGSLDKPYLFFPLFFIPPFSFIPVIFAKLGWIKKTNAGTPLDIYLLIPIIFRFILIILLTNIPSIRGINRFILQTVLLLGALLLANILHVASEKRCKDKHKFNLFGSLLKESSDSMLQYAAGVLGTFLVLFIPYIGTIIKTINSLPIPYISQIIESVIWGLGIATGYLLINMYDGNFLSAEEACTGKIGHVRILISIVAFAASIVYQLRKYLFR